MKNSVVASASSLPAELASAKQSLERHDSGQALRSLLAAWRLHRDPDLADLIDLVSADLNRSLPPLDPEPKTFHERWMKVAGQKRPEDIERLLPGLGGEPFQTAHLRITALLEAGPDPRVARRFGEMIDRPPMTSSRTFATWTSLFKGIPELNDIRLRPTLAAGRGVKASGDVFAKRFASLLKKANGELVVPPPLPSGEAAMLKQLVALAKQRLIEPAPAMAEPSHETPSSSTEAPSFPDPARALVCASEALEAVKTRKLEQSLDALLGAWQAMPLDAVAGVIDTLSSELCADLPAIGGAKKQHEAWLAVESEGRAADIPRLLAAALGGSLPEAELRLGRLVHRQPDARIGSYAVDLFGKPVGNRPVLWKTVAELALRHAGPDAIPALEARWGRSAEDGKVTYGTRQPAAQVFRLLPQLRDRFLDSNGQPKLGAAGGEKAKLGELMAAVSGAIGSLAQAKGPARSQAAQTENALREAVVADWANDAPKLVYADWLTERGGDDALRGELILLQCKRAAGDRSPALAAREKLLLKDLVPLMGPLSKAVKKSLVKFERGFLVEIGLDNKGVETVYDQILGHPFMGTVRTVTLDYVAGKRETALLVHPVMTSLRKIVRGNFEMLAELCEAKHPVPLEYCEYVDENKPSQAFLDGAMVPNLAILRRDGDSLAAKNVLQSPLFRRLRRLEVRISHWPEDPNLDDWLKALSTPNHPLPCLFAYTLWEKCTCELTRGSDGKLSVLTVSGPSDPAHPAKKLWEGVEAIAGHLTQVRVAKNLPADAVAIIAAIAKKHRLAVEPAK